MAEAAAEQKVQESKPAEVSTKAGAEKTDGSDERKSDKTDDDQRHPDRRASRDDGNKGDRRDKRDRRDGDRRGGGRGRGRGDRRGGGGFRGRGGNDRRGGGGFQNRERNVRTRYEREEESNDAGEMRRQVEFYFSDSNLPVDKYLLQLTGGHENKPFPLKSIHSFKRMRHFQPFSALVEAVKGSDFLEVNDQDEVSRKVPLDEKFGDDPEANNELLTSETIKRSIYAKGFGEEQEKSAFEIEEFFQPYGVRSVRLRRQQNGTFKGSVFVEFEDEDAAKQFLEMDDKPKFNDKELIVKSKKDYIDEKSQGILDGTVKPRSPTRSGFRGRGGRNGGDFKRKRNYDDDADEDVEDRDNWRDRRDKFQKDGRGRGRGRGRGNDRRGGRDRDGSRSVSRSRSRSRSPYREEKKEQVEDAKPEEAKKETETEVKEAEKTEAEKTEA